MTFDKLNTKLDQIISMLSSGSGGGGSGDNSVVLTAIRESEARIISAFATDLNPIFLLLQSMDEYMNPNSTVNNWLAYRPVSGSTEENTTLKGIMYYLTQYTAQTWSNIAQLKLDFQNWIDSWIDNWSDLRVTLYDMADDLHSLVIGDSSESSALNQSISNFNNTAESVSAAEGAVFGSVEDNLTTEKIRGLFPDIRVLRAIPWISNYLQRIFDALGDFGIVITVGLALALGMQFIGYWRYK